MTTYDDYVSQNTRAYDAAASEYSERTQDYAKRDIDLLKPFFTKLPQGGSVLELGPGSGLGLKILEDRGFQTTAIDISANMLDVSALTSPASKLLQGDFLAYDFGEMRFDGVIAKAFFHCFPKVDALRAINKARTLLEDDGLLFLATSVHEEPSEGFEEKSDYSNAPVRFRKRWTDQELIKVFSEGWVILDKNYNSERGKNWLALTVRKTPD